MVTIEFWKGLDRSPDAGRGGCKNVRMLETPTGSGQGVKVERGDLGDVAATYVLK